MQNFEIIVINDRKVLDQLGTITTYPSPDFIRRILNCCPMSEEELLQKKVGILGLGFPPAWRDREQLAAAMDDRTPGTLDETIKGSPAVLVVVYDTRKRAPASERDVLGMLSLGCVMENMWLMAQKLDIGFQIMSIFSVPCRRMSGISCRYRNTWRYHSQSGWVPSAQPDSLRVRRDSESFTYRNA